MSFRFRILVITLLLIPFFSGDALAARPFRGSAKWSILLCNFSDSSAPNRTVEFFRDMIIRQGTGGVADYWNNVSYGRFNLDGSVVMGWYNEPFTTQQARSRTRDQRFQDCIDAAHNSNVSPYTPPSDHLVAVITNPGIDLFGWPGRGAFLPIDTEVGAIVHETGHGLGLNHSFSDDPNYKNADWAQIGEYDDQWDVMSYANVFGVRTSRFGYGGPGLNAFHLDRMGWLSRSRIFTFGSDSIGSQTLTLAAINHPEAPGFLLIRIPFDPGDLFHYYILEFRRRDGWDGGIPRSIILIHEVKIGSDGQYYSYLLREHSGVRTPLQSIDINGVSISVNTMSEAINQSSINITSDIVVRCVVGYVWREANTTDRVCVTGATREQTRIDNQLAPTRVNPNGGPYGPDTCLEPYVWREAFLGDHVCVTRETRTQASQDNAQADVRRNPARFVYGPNTCKQGFVWREADDSDWVCVTGATREQTRIDNQLAPTRVNPNGGPYGPDTCLEPYVWREAFLGDHVCVTRETRTQASQDNAQANSRLEKP